MVAPAAPLPQRVANVPLSSTCSGGSTSTCNGTVSSVVVLLGPLAGFRWSCMRRGHHEGDRDELLLSEDSLKNHNHYSKRTS